MQLLMRRPEVDGFICVAPPSNLYDFSFLAPCPSSGLMINGDKDRVVPSHSVGELSPSSKTQRGIKIDAPGHSRRQPLLREQDRGAEGSRRRLRRCAPGAGREGSRREGARERKRARAPAPARNRARRGIGAGVMPND